ncbi:MAG: PAS domain-containing protein [Euryarchaeota archaeon]|nr:PAS domain-containing protein [Euryarchaeota archaeon]
MEDMDFVGGRSWHSGAVWRDLYSAIKDLVSEDGESSKRPDANTGKDAPLIHIKTGLDLVITYSNDVANLSFPIEGGLKQKSFIGNVIPADKELQIRVDDWLERVKEGQDDGLDLIVSVDGPERGLRWFSFVAEPIKMAKERLTGLWWAGKDVTSSFACPMNRRPSLGTVDLVMRMTLPSMAITQDGEILMWNKAWADTFGLSSGRAYANGNEMLGALLSSVKASTQLIDGILIAASNDETGIIELKDGTKHSYHIIEMTRYSEEKVVVLEPTPDQMLRASNAHEVGKSSVLNGCKIMELVNVVDFIVEREWDGMFILDDQGLVVKWDRRMEEITEVPSKVALGKAISAMEELLPGIGKVKSSIIEKDGEDGPFAHAGPMVLTTMIGKKKEITLEIDQVPISTQNGRAFTFWCTCVGDDVGTGNVDESPARPIVEDRDAFLIVTDRMGDILYATQLIDMLLGGRKAIGRNIVEMLPEWSNAESGCRKVDFKDADGVHRSYNIGAVRMAGPSILYIFYGTRVVEEVPMTEGGAVVHYAGTECDAVSIATELDAVEGVVPIEGPSWFSLRGICKRAAEKMGSAGFEMLGEIDDVRIFADPHLENVLLLMFDDVLNHSTDDDHIELAYFNDEDGGRIIVSNIGVLSPLKMRWERCDILKDPVLFDDIVTMKDVLDVTGFELEVSEQDGRGLRFEIFVPRENIDG